ncbi:MAG: TonB family protein [Betaproteobacteria bacterium]|nr:TonB family protein [Betaproteobacteria bacterium]
MNRYIARNTLIRRAAAAFTVAGALGTSPANALELTPLAASAAATSQSQPGVRDTLARQLADPVYDAAVRERLVQAARYPRLSDANRPAPRGKTTVVFELSPEGQVVDAAITESSRSRLLDKTALAIVRRAGLDLRADAAANGASRRYRVTLDFQPDAQP